MKCTKNSVLRVAGFRTAGAPTLGERNTKKHLGFGWQYAKREEWISQMMK